MFGLSFAESIIFPIPIDPLLAACIIAKRNRVVFLTSFTVLASVIGGIFGWLIGLYLGIGLQNIIEYVPGVSIHDFENVNQAISEWGLLLSFIGAFTPLPYKLIALSSGATGVPLLIFIIGSIFGRGLRFSIVASLSYFFGERAIKILANNLTITTVIIGIFIIIIWFLIM